MNNIRFTIRLPPVSKKNSQQIITNPKTGKHIPLPSKAYRNYEKNAGWFIGGGLRMLNISKPVNVKYMFYMPTHRIVDLTNLTEAADDMLVKYGVLKDDNSRIVVSHDGSRVLYDKNNPRTEITISFYDVST